MQLILDIKKLGPVKNSQVIWRPLTVFIGPNNTGKTYTAYLIHGLLNTLPLQCGLDSDKIEELFNREQLKLDFEETKKAWLEAWQKKVKETFLPEFWETYFAVQNHEPEIQINLSPDKCKAKEFIVSLGVYEDIDKESIIIGDVDYKITIKKDKKNLLLSILDVSRDVEKLNDDDKLWIAYNEFEEYFCEKFAYWLGFPEYSFVIPAERTSFLFYKHWFVLKDKIWTILMRSKLSEILDVKKSIYSVLKEFHFPKIFEDFLSFLLLVERKKELKCYEDAIELLNKKLLKGNVQIKDGEFLFNYGKGTVGISGASSAVKALLPLEKFLRTAPKGAFLVIDEPEMHLHPEAQVVLAIALAVAINSGLRVLLTTHSPYILDTFNFLVWAHQINAKLKTIDDPVLKEKFQNILHSSPFDVPENALLSPEIFSAYFFKHDGLVEDIKKVVSEELDVDIDWHTFSQVSDDLWEKSGRLGELRDEILQKQ